MNALPIKEDLRARICDRIVLLSGPILLLSATLIANGPLITPGRPMASLFTVAGLLFLAIAALRRRLPTALKASLFLVLTLGLFLATQLLFGRQAPPSVVGAIAVLFSVVFFRPWVSVLIVSGIVAVTTLVQVTGLALHPLADPGHALAIKSSWTYKLVPILFGISYMLVIGGALINGYDHALRRLSDSEAGLEDALAERTEELQEALALALAREQEMQRIAFRDELTGLLSKHRLERFYQDIAADESLADVPHAIALVNIRDFSDINDSYGYAIGNIVLREVARLLLETCDRRDLVARLSADEFVIVLRWARAQGSLERRLALLQQQLDRELYVAGHGIALRCAIGVANYPEDGRDLPAMYRAARRAWRRARDQGSHALAVFDAAQDGRGEHRLEMIEALRAALASNAIHLHFQPIVRLDDMRVVAAEGLARWELDNGELRSPAEFLSLANASGQMRALNQRNLAEVTALLGDWETDPQLAPISVSFNLSARDLLDDTIAEALAAVEHLQGKLTVEITESDLVNDVDALRTVIRRLRRRGIRVAIDDFGVGYSSLARLHQLEVDIVKLDGSFIADIEDRQESRDLVRAVIDIVHKLGAQVTAEYVQTAGQVALLRDMGCDFGQGSFVAHALSRARFEHLIRQGQASETLKYQCC